MSAEDIRSATEGFALAAARARDAGFDGVEIHAANGYLLDQFLTTYTNRRSDPYGGPVENRIRLTVEVVRAVVRTVGSDFVVGVRLSQTKVNDLAYRWPGGSADARLIFDLLREAGTSYLHVASEGSDWIETARLDSGETITALAKQVTGLPVLANGGLDEPEKIAAVLTERHADIVTLGRAALANADWPTKLARGVPFEAFCPSVLHPSASLENAARWRSERSPS
jgi:2,4-dienoyl-CoA reductase-like NADH-dependent reductase (Old Yellow Enzyme family)